MLDLQQHRQLERGRPLAASQHVKQSDQPLAKRQVRAVHHRSGLNREIDSTIPATEGLRLTCPSNGDASRLACRTTNTIRPAPSDEPGLGCGIIGKKFAKTLEAQPGALPQLPVIVGRPPRSRPLGLVFWLGCHYPRSVPQQLGEPAGHIVDGIALGVQTPERSAESGPDGHRTGETA